MTTHEMRLQIQVDDEPDGISSNIGGTGFYPADESAKEGTKAAKDAILLSGGEATDDKFNATIRVMTLEQFIATSLAMRVTEFVQEYIKSNAFKAAFESVVSEAKSLYKSAKEAQESAGGGGYRDLTKEGK